MSFYDYEFTEDGSREHVRVATVETFPGALVASSPGGFILLTASDAASGALLPAGAGAWGALSDRDAKTGLEPVDARAVLDRVAGLPLYRWSYRAQDPSIRHLGPTAQDFRAAFNLGESERHISTVDADGVALAAIQGLWLELQERDARIAHLEARLAALESLR